MIATCTVNPSLDYYLEFEHPLHEGTNRSTLEYYEAGGKGINISVVLSNMGIPSKAFGFVGGFTKDFFIKQLSVHEDIRPNFSYINGHTRINVKCGNNAAADLNAVGPQIDPNEVQNMYDKLGRLAEGDFLAFAGAVQEDLEQDMVKMLKQCIANDIYVVLDTNPDILREVSPSHPFMVKSTPAELAAVLGEEVTGVEGSIEAAKKLQDLGAQRVLVLVNKQTAVFVNKDGTYTAEVNRNPGVTDVGIGNALVAGYLMDYTRSHDDLESFRYGVSCASAGAYVRGSKTKERIEAFVEKVEVTKVD